MIIGITVPIACSDLRGPKAISNEELEKVEMQITEPTITINGIETATLTGENVTTGGMGAFQLVADEYGLFKIAPRKFEGAIQAGKIGDNTISFKINELNVAINTSNEIIGGYNNNPIWVAHFPIEADEYQIIALPNALAEMPPPPPSVFKKQTDETGSDYFVVVEQMPKLIGGMQSIQSKIEYPELAERAGIEGRVTVQFIINENGDVENAKVVRGIGGGADEEALRVIREAKFEPGMQRGKPVRLQYAMSINFALEDSEFSETSPPPPPTEN
jgi:TonB family protein